MWTSFLIINFIWILMVPKTSSEILICNDHCKSCDRGTCRNCTVGWFGGVVTLNRESALTCDKPCPQNCKFGHCDARTGFCTEGCKHGHYDTKCESNCLKRCVFGECDSLGNCTLGLSSAQTTPPPTRAPTQTPPNPTRAPTPPPPPPTRAPTQTQPPPTRAPTQTTLTPTRALMQTTPPPTREATPPPPPPAKSPTKTPPPPTRAPTQTTKNPTRAPTQTPPNPTRAPTPPPAHPTRAPTQTPPNPTRAPSQTPLNPTRAPTQTQSNPARAPTQTQSNPTRAPTPTQPNSAQPHTRPGLQASDRGSYKSSDPKSTFLLPVPTGSTDVNDERTQKIEASDQFPVPTVVAIFVGVVVVAIVAAAVIVYRTRRRKVSKRPKLSAGIPLQAVSNSIYLTPHDASDIYYTIGGSEAADSGQVNTAVYHSYGNDHLQNSLWKEVTETASKGTLDLRGIDESPLDALAVDQAGYILPISKVLLGADGYMESYPSTSCINYADDNDENIYAEPDDCFSKIQNDGKLKYL